MHPFDRKRCSFHVPESFATRSDELAFMRSLREDQKWELLDLMNRWKWGDAACDAKMERVMRVISMDEEK